MDLGVPDDTDGQSTENPKFFKDGCWKSEHSPANSMIFVDLRVSTNFSVYNGKLGQFLLIKCAIYIRPRVDLGFFLLLVVAVVVLLLLLERGRKKKRERERGRRPYDQSLPLKVPLRGTGHTTSLYVGLRAATSQKPNIFLYSDLSVDTKCVSWPCAPRTHSLRVVFL